MSVATANSDQTSTHPLKSYRGRGRWAVIVFTNCHRTGSPNFVAVAIITVICKSGNVVTVTAARTKQSRAVRPSRAVHLCLISTTTRQPLRHQSQCLLVHMNMSTTRFRLYQISRKDILRQGARIVQLMSINHLWEFRSMFTDLFDPICL